MQTGKKPNLLKVKNREFGIYFLIIVLIMGGVISLLFAFLDVEFVFAETPFCQNTSTNLLPEGTFLDNPIPFSDMRNGDKYLGFEGGLYPESSPSAPMSHLREGDLKAQEIQPLDEIGLPDPVNGKIVFMSIGMSNTMQEFEPFIEFVETQDAIPNINEKLVFVNGAAGGMDARKMSGNDPDPDDQAQYENYWAPLPEEATEECLPLKHGWVACQLRKKGVTPEQVQIIWLKHAIGIGNMVFDFPDDANLLKDFVKEIIVGKDEQQHLKMFPNLKIIYLSNRTYAGYASTNLNPEPYAYQTGFAVKGLIEDQITSNDPELDYSVAPWLSWGPDLWTNGVGPDGFEGGEPGRRDGLEWICSDQDLDGDGCPDGDVEWDGTHPSVNGEIKVANILVSFLKNDLIANRSFLFQEPTTPIVTPMPTPPPIVKPGPTPFPTGTPEPTPSPTPPTGKSFTFKCNHKFLEGPVFSLERLILELGENETCSLKLTNLEPGTSVEVSTNLRTGFKSSIKVEPISGVSDASGELEFTINGIDRGIDWVAFAVPNENGEFEFSKEAYDTGLAWGMFVEVK